MPARKRPSFKAPPVAEVVCGIQFRPLTQFEAPHYGLFWEIIIKEYPRSRTLAAINTGQMVEVLPHELITVPIVVNAPEMPRVWFVSEDDTCLIQLQPDRFLFNWREGPNRAPYPRYKNVIKKFRELFQTFEKFVARHKLGNIVPISYELSYINYIRQGQGWKTFADIGEIFPDLSWRTGDRFVSEPVNFAFRSAHVMSPGQLQLSVQSAKSAPEKAPLIRFDIAARVAVTELRIAHTVEMVRYSEYVDCGCVRRPDVKEHATRLLEERNMSGYELFASDSMSADCSIELDYQSGTLVDVSSEQFDYQDRKARLRAAIDAMVEDAPTWSGEQSAVSMEAAKTAQSFLRLLTSNRELPKVAPDGEGDVLFVWEPPQGNCIVAVQSNMLHMVDQPGTQHVQHIDSQEFFGDRIPLAILHALPMR